MKPREIAQKYAPKKENRANFIEALVLILCTTIICTVFITYGEQHDHAHVEKISEEGQEAKFVIRDGEDEYILLIKKNP